jgi:ABC-type uncharacterized transport system substrate-binding protein
MRPAILGFAALTILAFPQEAAAHPHVFINNVVSFVFEKEQVTGIHLEWTFDELFSSTVLEGFDQNGDGAFDAGEIKEAEAGAFSNLRDYHYFSNLWVDGQAVAEIAVRDFTAAAKDGIVTYNFVIPLAKPVDPAQHRVEVSIYDEEYYVDVALDENDPVRFENEPGGRCHYEIAEDKANPYYFGMVFPQRIKLICVP